jgi:3-methyladenine DNA glycosylase AlkD
MQELVNEFGHILDTQASQESKEWWQGYLKNVIPFRGVGIPAIRSQLKKFYNEKKIDHWPVDQQFDLALQFFEGRFTEDKLSGILFIQLYVMDKLDYMKTVPHYKKLFSKNLIYDWNVCDWFCIRILGPTIDKSENACAKWISGWRSAENLWQSRASLVAFVNLAENKDYYDLIKKSAEILIRQQERFRKTAVGWIMREIAHYDKMFVMDFLKTNLPFFSAETLRNVLKHFEKEEKQQWLITFKEINIKNKN